jgi:ribA/ribD-fused uncharacterized protein
MSFYSIAHFIKENYPQYYSIETYPQKLCITIHKVKQEWGIFSNFAHTPIVIDKVIFKNIEQLYQVMKFTDIEAVVDVYNARNPKMTAKKWEKTHRRPDWGNMLVDAIKYCIQAKYEQCEDFRFALEKSRNYYIVEDQSTFPKKNPDTWGVKLIGDNYIGPNLLGRLLMEIRDKNNLVYSLPNDALLCIDILKTHCTNKV